MMARKMASLREYRERVEELLQGLIRNNDKLETLKVIQQLTTVAMLGYASQDVPTGNRGELEGRQG